MNTIWVYHCKRYLQWMAW